MNFHKNIFKASWMLLSAFFLLSCEKDDATEHISKVTTYAVLDLKGDEFVVVPQGGTYTDAGAEALIGQTPAEVEVSYSPKAVDPNVPGVYVITYTATNEDGFSASITRKVGVISAATAAMDISGKYKRDAGAFGVSTVTKLGPGFYQTDNVGGVAAGGPSTTVKFFHYEGNKLAGPPQDVMGSTFSVIDGTLNPGVSYSWIVINSGYGAAMRTFVKQ
ncbi:MAG: immunoglobulin-like domain-containing protein [Adhaeribacter sp.]